MPRDLYVYDGSWRNVSIPSVYDGSWREVSTGFVYDNGWQQFWPVSANPAASLRITRSPSSIDTFGSSIVTVQLLDSAGNATAGTSPATITLSSSSGLGVGYFLNGTTQTRTISGNTDAGGQYQRTFFAGSNADTTTITASSSGFANVTTTITVSLQTGWPPELGVVTPQQWGFSFPHTNVNSSYDYSGSSVSSANNNGSFFVGTNATNNPVSIYVATFNNTKPVVTQDANNVYCSQGSWGGGTGVSGVTATIQTTRSGYTTRSASRSGGATTTGLAANFYFTYQWKYWNGSTTVDWGNTSTTSTRSKGSIYKTDIKGKQLWCQVWCYRNYSGTYTGGSFVDTDKITAN